MKKTTRILLLLFIMLLLLDSFSFAQSRELDERISGRWTILFFKDSEGKILNNGFAGKNYIDTFFKNGTYSIDPNIFRDEAKKAGIKEPIDYLSIPTFKWKTTSDQILVIETGEGDQLIKYEFLGDTLIFGYPNGHTRYLLKRK
jgi:hypothetical protein